MCNAHSNIKIVRVQLDAILNINSWRLGSFSFLFLLLLSDKSAIAWLEYLYEFSKSSVFHFNLWQMFCRYDLLFDGEEEEEGEGEW